MAFGLVPNQELPGALVHIRLEISLREVKPCYQTQKEEANHDNCTWLVYEKICDANRFALGNDSCALLLSGGAACSGEPLEGLAVNLDRLVDELKLFGDVVVASFFNDIG